MWRPEALKVLGCSVSTLKRYSRTGKIRFTKVGSRNLYWDDDVYAIVGKKLIRKNWTAVYCRVPGRTYEDRQVMTRQQGLIREWCGQRGIPIDKLYEDWCPATDFSYQGRSGLHDLIQDVIKRRVSVIVVETPDRLARVGWEIFPAWFRYYGVEVVFVNSALKVPEYQQEQEKDLVFLLMQAGVTRLDELAGDPLAKPKPREERKHPGKITPNWEDAPDTYDDPDQELSDLM